MDRFHQYLLRRRQDRYEKKRVANLLRNSNSFGTTASLSSQQPHRIFKRDLLEFDETKKDSLVVPVNPYELPIR